MQRNVSKEYQHIEDIYGFSVSHEMISDITDAIILNWKTGKPTTIQCYAFLFVDCLYVTVENDYE